MMPLFMKAKVTVMPKRNILDPQGEAVRDAMRQHGAQGVDSVRIGKVIEIDAGEGAELGEERLHALCRELLSNPVIEDYELVVES